MHRFWHGSRLLGGVLVAASLGILAAAPVQAADPIRVKLEWLPSGIHSWYHLADQKGWYKDAGLTVEIEDGKGSAVGIQLVAAGKFDIGGCINLSTAAIARGKGVPVKVIAAMAQKSDLGFVFPKGKNWKTPKDLVDAGAIIIMSTGDAWAPLFETIFRMSGSDVHKAKLTAVSPAAKMSSYIIGTGNMAMTTVPAYAIPLIEKERPSDFFMLYETGMVLPGWGLISSDEALKKRPDDIRTFVKVTMKAFQYVINGHQAEGLDAIFAARPDNKINRDTSLKQLQMYQPLFASPKDKPAGYMEPAAWKSSLALMADVGLVPKDIKPADVFTNDYVQ